MKDAHFGEVTSTHSLLPPQPRLQELRMTALSSSQVPLCALGLGLQIDEPALFLWCL